MGDFGVVLDCTDNPASRYLLSDVCAAYKIPLVSGAAIRAEGQLAVWNLPSPAQDPPHDQRGPCYRCIFPQSDLIRAERCLDHGVLGPAVGVVGVLMAWETIRLLIGTHDLKPKLLLVPSFRTVKLRKAKKDCLGCSNASISAFLDGIKMQTSGDIVEGEDGAEEARLLNACPMHSSQPPPTSTQRISAHVRLWKDLDLLLTGLLADGVGHSHRISLRISTTSSSSACSMSALTSNSRSVRYLTPSTFPLMKC